MKEDVPLVIPEVNASHIKLIDIQGWRKKSGGYVVTNPNCSAIGLVLALAPLHQKFGLETVMVVGTTGWYKELDRVRSLVEKHQTGFLYSANFSIGVNLFLEIARGAAAALEHDYSGQIFERHHAHKKDAPSGTAIALQQAIHRAVQKHAALEITSFREGEVVGLHEVVFESPVDRIYLCHDSKSRRGFAEGAVRAAEWLAGKKGFYEFKDIWREL